MKILSPTMLISFGLASLTLTIVMAAQVLGIVPDQTAALARARTRACELSAAQVSAALSQELERQRPAEPLPLSSTTRPVAVAPAVTPGFHRSGSRGRGAVVRVHAPTTAPAALPVSASESESASDSLVTIVLHGIAERDPDLRWSRLTDADGRVLAAAGEAARSSDRGVYDDGGLQIRVPVYRNGLPAGEVRFGYRSDAVGAGGPLEVVWRHVPTSLRTPIIPLALFVAAVGFGAYFFYLRRTLRHLDPSTVIPTRVRAMLDALSEGVAVLDKSGRIVMANESFARVVGRPVAALQGKDAAKLGWADPVTNRPVANVPWAGALRDGVAVHGVTVALPSHATGPGGVAAPPKFFAVNAAPVLGPDGSRRGALATFDDLTTVERLNNELATANAELNRLATTDVMTGCLNRRSFLQQFDAHWAASARAGVPVACVMVDVDRFKSINDRFGHPAGDAVLKDVAAILLAAVDRSAGELTCRYGGEEFCLLLPGLNADAATEVAARVRAAIEGHAWMIAPVTVSIGVSSSHFGADPGGATTDAAPATDVKALLDQADKALYASKRTGRNRVSRWGHLPAGWDVAELAPIAPVALAEAGGSCNAVWPSTTATSIPMLDALTTALAHRDIPTALHCRRVANLCVAAAPGLIGAARVSEMEAAALLHDLGKLGIPDSILHKPGPLTPAEWDVMRGHDQIGVDILVAAGAPPQVVWIVAAHHAVHASAPGSEVDWVVTAAALLSVADAYDAMTSDRPYRKAMSHAAAVNELRNGAGKQFSPVVVDHFVRHTTPMSPPGRPEPSPTPAAA